MTKYSESAWNFDLILFPFIIFGGCMNETLWNYNDTLIQINSVECNEPYSSLQSSVAFDISQCQEDSGSEHFLSILEI